ncbi:MAG TPA: class I SAM-dependent methyltransferase [Chloroflexi bacterium]|nr:class I SAM-dependent methyltransferase [Chloroflexota bacterium]
MVERGRVSGEREMEEKTIRWGHPSYVWRSGQERRLRLILEYVPLQDKRILDVGCGLGLYVKRFRDYSDEVYGVDIDPEKVAEASKELPNIKQAPAEALPFDDGFFDVVMLHEVLEHVDDDRQAVIEACRVLRPGGKMVIFAPNRLYFFETHGCYWRGKYHFGNIPLINYLPNFLRNRLCPHVRAYTSGELRKLFQGLPVRCLVHTQIYPGYDNIAHRRPWLASLLRKITYTLEKSPLRIFGLSHFMVMEKVQHQ